MQEIRSDILTFAVKAAAMCANGDGRDITAKEAWDVVQVDLFHRGLDFIYFSPQ